MDFNLDLSSVSIGIRGWYFSFFFWPCVWGLQFHREAECCKWWLLIGPFEINRVWLKDDVYPFHFPEFEEDEDEG